MATKRTTGEQIASLVTIAALLTASCISLVVMWSGVLAAVIKLARATARMMISLSMSLAPKTNQAMQSMAP